MGHYGRGERTKQQLTMFLFHPFFLIHSFRHTIPNYTYLEVSFLFLSKSESIHKLFYYKYELLQSKSTMSLNYLGAKSLESFN